MANTNTQHQSVSKNTSKLIGDIVVTWKDGQFKSAKHVKVKNEKEKDYLINGDKIIDVVFVQDYDIIIFETKNQCQFRNENFELINGSEAWKDYYIDPFHFSFYRKDGREFWYDIEGARLTSTFIRKGDILISLPGKTTIKNGVFDKEELYTSPNMKMVQIGKVVLDEYLKPVLYQGQRITGLHNVVVTFEDGTVYQAVKLGIDDYAFINEDTKDPIIMNGEALTSLCDKVTLGKKQYYIFHSLTREHFLSAQNAKPIIEEGRNVTLYPSTFIGLDTIEIVAIKSNDEKFYYNLNTLAPLQLAELGDRKITKAYRSNIPMENMELINVSTKNQSIVIKSNDLSRYTGTNTQLAIEKIINVPGFEGIFAMVTIKGKQHLFSLKSEQIIYVDELSIVGVDGYAKSKLLNAITSDGQRVVIDVRRGFDDLHLALSDGDNIIQTTSEPYQIGSKVLQNVRIQTLGGAKDAVIDLNDSELSKFTFPRDMSVFADVKSIFAGTPIISIDFTNIIEIEDKKFMTAQFRAYDDTLHNVILDKETGRPLQMDGLGHRSELVTKFSEYSLNTIYNLGPHRMIGVQTLKEDLKPDELLFSIQSMTSWLPFSEGYLPIFKKVVELNDGGSWDYHLFELRELSKDKEYIAVEQSAPYRILVRKKTKKNIPIVVKSKEKILKSPSEISMIRKLFFEDPGVLVEVYL